MNIKHSAFIKGRHILDEPFLINEVIAWSKASKNPLIIFKVDFEKSYHSLSWEYLQEIMQIMGFGSKWCWWIMELLNSTKASILVNSSFTCEF